MNQPMKEKTFSWKEIVKHKSADDCWMVVKGKVYNVTNWVSKHPGGDLILQGAGRESTAMFTSYHPLRIEKQLESFCIGKVEDSKHPPFYDWDSSDFYPVLKRRVEEHLKQKGIEGGSLWMYLKTTIIVLCWMMSWYFTMIRGSVLFAFSLGFWQSQFGINIAHDGNHGAYSKIKWLNRLAALTMDFIGASSIVWAHQHNIGHHPNSNRQGDSCKSECDQDDPDTKSGAPLLRIAPAQPHLWYHKYQVFYVWLLFCFVTFKWYVNDIKSFMKNKYVNIEFYNMGRKEIWSLTFTKILFALYMFLIPCYLFGFQKAAVLTFITMAVKSYFFVAMFSVNHLTEDSVFPDESFEERDWAKLQVLTASNFAVGSTFWTWLAGGLNYQIEHHLFPYICHVHLPEISHIVQKTCKEYNVEYKQFPSFFDAFQSYCQQIQLLGNGPEKKTN
eukprot:TRINITY_DN1047_c0_g1_i1.p1 TRINITY_DN1047_c0_g1~~TRINITY_DN1047_c0_g1_i1.p1  ORF type:complete len:444 (+),score=96.31 TRINITY_DN1047_c0_g1_i1:144-1475(+)